jgi:hypothetical protein
VRLSGISSNRHAIGHRQKSFHPNNAPSAANANARRHSSIRHSPLTGVKRLQASHDCFGIGPYYVKPRDRGREEAYRLARLRSSAAQSSPRYYAYSAIKAPDKGEVGGSSPPRPTILFSRLPGVAPKASTHNPTHNLLHHLTPHTQRRKIFSLRRERLIAVFLCVQIERRLDFRAEFGERFSVRFSLCSPASC